MLVVSYVKQAKVFSEGCLCYLMEHVSVVYVSVVYVSVEYVSVVYGSR